MKKLILSIIVLICIVTTGCKSIPTDSKMYTTSYAVGTSTGLITNMTKIDNTTRNTVIDIVNIVAACIPETNQTFTAVWTPIATAHTNKLVEQGKINAGQAILITKSFDVVCNGIDYLFNVRYPKARQYQELVEAATHGFSDGFLTTFKPVNTVAIGTTIQIDDAAYKYLADKYLK